MKHERKFYWLDLIRGVSALAVFSSHLRILCFTDVFRKELPLFGKMIFFLTGFGHQAVMVFFILSGFFITRSIHEQANSKSWSFLNYGINRLSRLWVVLLPALVIGLILDKVGSAAFPDALGYSGHVRYFTEINLKETLQPKVFLGNVLFLQAIFVPMLGTNGSLWSLTNEFWYYVAFPLLYFSASRRYHPVTRVMLALVAIAVLVMVGEQIARYFIVWLLGGLGYMLFRHRNESFFSNRLVLWGSLLLFFLVLMMSGLNQATSMYGDFLLGLTLAILVPCLTKVSMRDSALKKTSIFLSEISYTLYVVHLPFAFFVTSASYFQAKTWSMRNFLIYLAFGLMILLYATLMWYLFERNTHLCKRWMRSVLDYIKTDKPKVHME